MSPSLPQLTCPAGLLGALPSPGQPQLRAAFKPSAGQHHLPNTTSAGFWPRTEPREPVAPASGPLRGFLTAAPQQSRAGFCSSRWATAPQDVSLHQTPTPGCVPGLSGPCHLSSAPWLPPARLQSFGRLLVCGAGSFVPQGLCTCHSLHIFVSPHGSVSEWMFRPQRDRP